MNFVWSNARGKPVFVSSDSAFMGGFYLYQMYGAASTFELTGKVLTEDFPKSYPRVAFLLNANDALQVVDFARSAKASVSASSTRNHLHLLLVSFDGEGRLSGTGD
jgi:hypothetical protein